MAAPTNETLQLVTLTFPPHLHPDPSAPPPPVANLCARLRAVPGVAALHCGRQAERRDAWTLAVRWSSPAALDAFLASPAFADWSSALRAVADACLVCRVADLRGDPAAALAAPCTEVFSMFGTSAAFLDDRLAPFVAEIDRGRLLGYRGSAYGQLEALMHHGDVVSPEGRALVALIGWDSKDAHLAQRGDGKLIDKHIHYVREDRKSVDMYHVDLTQL